MDFVVDRAGEFYYYGPIPGPRILGMEGKFVVAGYLGTRPTNALLPISWAFPAFRAFSYSHLNPVR